MNKRAIAYLAKMDEVRKAKAMKATSGRANSAQQAQPVAVPPSKSVKSFAQTSSQKQMPQEVKEVIDKQFFHKCDNCNAPIFYDPLYLDDFTGRYIPLSSLTHRSHNCGRRKREKLESELGGQIQLGYKVT